MFEELEHLHRAVRLLISRNTTVNQRLYEAARELSLALRRPQQWPKDLLDKATQILCQLGEKGRIDTTINGMDAELAGRIAGEILELTMAADAAKHHRLEPAGHPGIPRSMMRRPLPAHW